MSIRAAKDPVIERSKARADMLAQQLGARTFEQCARQYIQEKRDEWSNEKHAAQWLSTLQKYAFPIIGSLDVAQIERNHVLAVLEQHCTKPKAGKLWKVKTETAVRVRSRIEQVLDWAMAYDFRDSNNPARWDGKMRIRLGDPKKFKKVRHHPALPPENVAELIKELRLQTTSAAGAGVPDLDCVPRW